MKITYFPKPFDLRKWFEKHHHKTDELWVGYYKKDSGKPSITWPESVDEALCFGWIDGIRKSVDNVSYKIRFTPRRAGSIWSDVNINRAQALIKAGRMTPAGLKAFEVRKDYRSGIYSYEQGKIALSEPYTKQLKKNKKAWEFFQAQPPSYRIAVNWWVMSAKQEETRLRRLDQLIKYSAEGQRIPQFTWQKKAA